MRKRELLKELKICALGTAIAAAVFASFLFFGMRARAATIRDGVHTPIYAELQTIDRTEIRAQQEAYQDDQEDAQIEQEVSQSDLDLLAAIVYAEAGDQDFTGQRLVADVVLNRVQSPTWPNTIAEVIYQPHQFSPVTDGGLDRAWGHVSESCYEAARLALSGDRIDTEIIYFSMYGCANGVFAYQHGDHFFGY